MDEIYAALCAKLREAGTGRYAVFYEDELLEVFPEKERGRDALEAALTRLAKEGCIDVRYARGPAFCLAYLKPFIPATPQPCAPDAGAEKTNKSRLSGMFAVCAAAFAGGAIGGIITALIGGVI